MDLIEFGRYNLIYGWNGTGKTTLSRLFRNLEYRQIPEQGEVVLQVDGNSAHNSDFTDIGIPIRVFNRDFIAENVFPVEGGDIPPVFVLGATSVEKQKKVEILSDQLATARLNLDSARIANERADREFDQFCVDRAKFVKEKLRSSGQNKYNNYNKTNYSVDAQKFIENFDAFRALTTQEHQRLMTLLHSAPMSKVSAISYSLPDFHSITATVSEILKGTVVSSAVEELKDDPALSSWVQQGLRLHVDRDVENCQFCEQQLPRNRLQKLEAHFNTAFERFIERIDQEIGVLEEHRTDSKKILEQQTPRTAFLFVDFQDEFKSAKADLIKAIGLAEGFLSDALQILENKRQHPFEQVRSSLKAPSMDIHVIEKINLVIEKHNSACDDFETRAQKVRDRLACDMIASELEQFESLRDAKNDRACDLRAYQTEIQRLSSEISKLEQEIVEHRRPAEELNIDLRAYLGHSELCLEVKETGYELTRSGQAVESLSEGETTAIALLYFLKSLQDKSFEIAKGVVLLDDPVSSLDANALFLAFGFIRERTKDAGQLFILTHNFSLFRQVRNWFRHLKNQGKKDIQQRPARFFMVNSVARDGARSSVIERLDPLLEQFESEYQFLFSRVYRASTLSEPQILEHSYFLPNIARRLLESFLAFRQPDTAGDLWYKLNAVSFDESRKLRILRFLHTHSHSDAVGDPEHDLTLLAESPTVLTDLLDLIESLDPDHCRAMLGLVSSKEVTEKVA